MFFFECYKIIQFSEPMKKTREWLLLWLLPVYDILWTKIKSFNVRLYFFPTPLASGQYSKYQVIKTDHPSSPFLVKIYNKKTNKTLIYLNEVIHKTTKTRSSHSHEFLRKGVLKICSKFTGEHPCRSAISIKLQSSFSEIALRHGCSPANLQHIFRTPFLGTPLGGCFCKTKCLALYLKIGGFIQLCLRLKL